MTPEHRKEMAVVAVLALLFCIGGSVLVVLGFRSYAETRAFIARADSGEGEVLGFEKWQSGAGSDERQNLLYAVVFFKTDDGREARFKGPSQDGLAKYRRGDKVRVLYNPDDPQDARINSFLGLWFGATMFWVVGGSSIVVPLLTLWQGWKWVKREEQDPGFSQKRAERIVRMVAGKNLDQGKDHE